MSLNELMARMAVVEARVAALEASRAKPSAQAAATGVADDRDLDSQWGNVQIKKDPPRWLKDGGASYAGRRMSECPSDYLRALASFYDWQADKDEESAHSYVNGKGETVLTAPFKRKDAARARGWARRNDGKPAAPAQRTMDDFDAYGDTEPPF
jgi:hypothetical protein